MEPTAGCTAQLGNKKGRFPASHAKSGQSSVSNQADMAIDPRAAMRCPLTGGAIWSLNGKEGSGPRLRPTEWIEKVKAVEIENPAVEFIKAAL